MQPLDSAGVVACSGASSSKHSAQGHRSSHSFAFSRKYRGALMSVRPFRDLFGILGRYGFHKEQLPNIAMRLFFIFLLASDLEFWRLDLARAGSSILRLPLVYLPLTSSGCADESVFDRQNFAMWMWLNCNAHLTTKSLPFQNEHILALLWSHTRE